MFEPIATRRKVDKFSACRRRAGRSKIQASCVTCWTSFSSPQRVSAIEADIKGARLMLPWDVEPGEEISVAVANQVGLFETRQAVVVWIHRFESTGKTVAGVAFDYELSAA